MDSRPPSSPPSTIQRSIPVLLALSGAFLLIGLAVIVLGGRYTRFHADDFCLAGEVVQRGFLAAQGYWYTAWSGRYAATLIATLLTLAGPGFAPIPAAIGLGLWLAGLTWAFYLAGEWLGWPRPALPALLLALSAIFAVAASIPNPYQSLHWITGLSTYTLPLALFSLGAGWILYQILRQNRKPPTWLLLANGLAACFMGGFSETYAAMQTTLFALAVLAALLFGRARTRAVALPVLAAWLAGSLAALGLIALAPGNAARQAQLAETPGLGRIVIFSLRNAAHIAGKYLLQTPLAAGASLLLPLALGWALPGKPLGEHPSGRLSIGRLWGWACVKGLAAAPLTGLILLVAACAPTVYAMNAYPDDRVIVTPQFFLALTAITEGYLFGRTLRGFTARLFRQRQAALMLAAAALALAVTSAAAAQSVRTVITQMPEAQNYAVRWDARAKDLHALGLLEASRVKVVSLETRFDLADLGTDPSDWVNVCVAKYYGFKTVTGR